MVAKTLAIFFTLLISAMANAEDRITPCTTEVVRTTSGVKSFEVQLVANNTKGYHTMRIYKNEGAQRTELPSVAIFHKSEGRVSKIVSVETRQTVMAYRERVAPTRKGIVLIQDGNQAFELEMTCYL